MQFDKNDFQILVFKTNILSEDDKQKIAKQINEENLVRKWTVDMADCDKVLRIVSSVQLPAEKIISIVQQAGYFCEEFID